MVKPFISAIAEYLRSLNCPASVDAASMLTDEDEDTIEVDLAARPVEAEPSSAEAKIDEEPAGDDTLVDYMPAPSHTPPKAEYNKAVEGSR